jgi:hypothetical protein
MVETLYFFYHLSTGDSDFAGPYATIHSMNWWIAGAFLWILPRKRPSVSWILECSGGLERASRCLFFNGM